jgi:4-amino-4-deoxy-L-arabinose transferase-like glycosyltransferase
MTPPLAHSSERSLPLGLLTLLLFIAALLPRLYALGDFLTIDEVKWAEGAAQFLLALHSGNLAQTYWHFFPGITIAWGGALTLWATCLAAPDLVQCAQTSVESLPQAIGWLRLTPVFLTSLGIAGVYPLGRNLCNEKIAILAALLLAFDPFFIAHSRILNGDATAAIFMFLSLLSFLCYWLKFSQRNNLHPSSPAPGWGFILHPSLLLSAILAGLALLTKLPAPLISLFIGGLGLVALAFDWPQKGSPAVRQWVGVLGGWGVIALAVVFLLWPALWVAPAATLRQMYFDSFQVGGLSEGHDAFFLGQILDDPGPWFYPYALAFRLTPVVMLGLVIALVWLILGARPARRSHNPEQVTAWVVLAYIIFIILLSSVSPKKLDRYVMAVIPALVFLAAVGLARIKQGSKGVGERRGDSLIGLPLFRFQTFSSSLLAGLVALQLVFALLAVPYYLAYYNPLLGGPERAITQVPVGWGEGLEQAARYLNQLPDAPSLTVSAWYSDIFQPYFVGQPASFADDGRAQLAANYVVFYANQLQRQKPYPGLLTYFRARPPVFVVRIGQFGSLTDNSGPNWVEVYQAPAALSASGAPKIEGVAQLLAYKVVGSRVASRKVAKDISNLLDNEVMVTLFLRVLGPLPTDSNFAVSLVSLQNPTSHISHPTSHIWPPDQITGEWQEGAVIEWPGILTLPPDTPPGDYRLAVALQTTDGSVIAELTISDKDPAIVIE